MNQETERRTDRSEAGDTLSPALVKLLLVCGGEVRAADRSRVEPMPLSDPGVPGGSDRRFTDRRHVERRFRDRRHDERRASSG